MKEKNILDRKDHIRIYAKDYKKRLESIGFKIEFYDIKKDLTIKYIRKYGFNENEILYVCRKL